MQMSSAQSSLAQEIWCHLDPKCTSDIGDIILPFPNTTTAIAALRAVHVVRQAEKHAMILAPYIRYAPC